MVNNNFVGAWQARIDSASDDARSCDFDRPPRPPHSADMSMGVWWYWLPTAVVMAVIWSALTDITFLSTDYFHKNRYFFIFIFSMTDFSSHFLLEFSPHFCLMRWSLTLRVFRRRTYEQRRHAPYMAHDSHNAWECLINYCTWNSCPRSSP